MHPLLQDIRYAIRLLLKSPGFTTVAIVTLALGIGANTAIFTVVNAVLLKPLPYGAPDRLVTVWQDLRARGGPADEWLTPGNYADLRREASVFEQVSVISGWRPILSEGAEPEPIVGEQVSHEYFSVLHITPVLGRTFTQQDDVPNAARVAVISHELWARRFGSRGDVVGQRVLLTGEPHEIIGVLPPRFRPIIARDAEIWRPLRLNTATPSRGAIVLRGVARLADGLSLEQAQAAATAIAQRLEAAYPEFNEKTGFNLTPLKDRVVGDVKRGLLALAGAVMFVLLIACANIANLLLARGSARARELAVRVALGAARARIVRQLLTESVILAAAGGMAGVLIGTWAVGGLVAIAPEGAPRLDEIALDATVLAFSGALALITGIVFGLAPALQASRGHMTQWLKDGTRGSTAGGGRGLRRALIAAEVALALALLTGGGLLLQTFLRLQAADLGFNHQNVLVAFVGPPRQTYDTGPKLIAYYNQVLEKASALPGVRTAALASVLPLSGDSDMSFAIEGRPAPALPSETPVTWYRDVSASYFEAMGMKVKAGRAFTAREVAPSVVVNETMARKYFPGENAIGKRVRFGPKEPWFTIIGIVADAKVRGAREAPRVETFIPYWQFPERGMNIILKSAGDPGLLAAPLKEAVYSVDRTIPLQGIGTLEEIVRESIGQPRFVAALAVAFAALALTLAAVGIYGVMAYTVSQMTTELGVRMALGAKRSEVFRLVIGDALKLTAAGVAAGVAISLLVARALGTLLFGVEPADLTTLAATSALLVAVAALASVIPARRATTVDPMVALRAE